MATGDLESWCRDHEGVVDDLHLEVGKLNKHWEHAIRDQSSTWAGLIPVPLPLEHAVQRPPADIQAARSIRHRDNNHHWDNEFGVHSNSFPGQG